MRQVHIHNHHARATTADALMGQMEGMARRAAMPKAPDLNALYEDLLERMMSALATFNGYPGYMVPAAARDAAWREDLHPRKSNGQFGEGEVTHADIEDPNPKPTSTTAKGGMDKMRELFGSGHAFTREELLAATGLVDRKLTDYLAMLKNPKWAGAKGALKIEKNDKGEYFVARADGTPAPPPTAPPVAAPPVLEGFDADCHERLNQMAAQLAIDAHNLSETTESHHAGERAKAHIRTAMAYMDETRRTSASPGYRTMQQDKAEQALRSAKDEINYGHAQQVRARIAREIEEAKVKALPPVAPPGKFEVYTPHKTVAEATAFAVQHGYADKVDFGRLDIRVVNDHLTAVSEHLAEFPQLRKTQEFMGSTQAFYKQYHEAKVKRQVESFRRHYPDKTDDQLLAMAGMYVKKPKAPGKAWALAHSGGAGSGYNAITFNEKYLARGAPVAKMDESLRRNVESKWHPIGGDSIKSIADHEIGHQLDNLLNLKAHPDVARLRREAYGAKPGQTEYGGIPVGPDSKSNMTNNVSAYANTNAAEFIAEAWSEYRNNPTPRPIAQQLGDLIRSEYAKKYPKA